MYARIGNGLYSRVGTRKAPRSIFSYPVRPKRDWAEIEGHVADIWLALCLMAVEAL